MIRPETRGKRPFDFPQTLRLIRLAHFKSQREFGGAAKIDPSGISRFEMGEVIPHRDELIHWSHQWGLPPDERDGLLISAGYLPELPKGMGKNGDDVFLIREAFKELSGKKPRMGCIEMLHARLRELVNT